MGDILYRVALPVGKVIHRVYAPRVASTVVVGVEYPVENGIAHEHVGVRHVYFRTDDLSPLWELPSPHPMEKIEVLGRRPIAPRAIDTRLGNRATPNTYLMLGLVIYVG